MDQLKDAGVQRENGVMVTSPEDDGGLCSEDGEILTLYNTSLPRQFPVHNPYFYRHLLLRGLCIKLQKLLETHLHNILSYESY
jgi:hypothetical protein